ncbi:lysylphosphatidylglycerol synthase transmembrane domain-containing protein [Rhodohalobacter sp. 8-1]|uniref:lysylphosphatidylglycerol synthase transmembrane domain-containing protein n=1 Tax=Rhodohalobacter sp. 8-1 TaxID=3131972 RepID=UPI0030EDAD09
MNKRVLNVVVSLIVAGIFIWLAARTVDPAEFREQFSQVSFYWLPFFVIALLISHYLRAERWRLLLHKDVKTRIPRSTLFAGVMFGYFMNTLVPRLGEVSRPVYVAKKHGISSGNLLGTIVLERFIDVCSMFLLMGIVALTLTREFDLLEELFGISSWTWYTYLVLPAILIFVIGLMWAFYKFLAHLDHSNKITNPFLQRIVEISRSFGEGLVSIKNIDNWPVFLLLTAGIWFGYILMIYIPFSMLQLGETYGLTLQSAMVLTVVSSVGVTIPTPAGIGSYHLLMQQSMWLLYNVPLATGLTFATVAHAVTILLILLAGPFSLWFDKYYTLKKGLTR